MQQSKLPRVLTIDEKKAADAAFKGLPFNSTWSDAARHVYEGIRSALGGPSSFEAPSETAQAPSLAEQSDEIAADTPAPLLTREEAVQTGFLIDVTATATRVGLPVPVALSKPLWVLGITAGDTIPENQQESRVRDVLMALRLRLSYAQITSAGMEFAALLSFPPEPTAQVVSLYAIAHGDHAAPYALTILLANEVTAVIRPISN